MIVGICLLLLIGGPPIAVVVAQESRTPTCFGQPATIVGTNGDEWLDGTEGDDVIVALDGDDSIAGNGGRDLLCGGRGNDLPAVRYDRVSPRRAGR